MINVAIFPAGQSGKKLVNLLKQMGDIDALYLVDNNPNMYGKEYNGVVIVSPYKMSREYKAGKIDMVLLTSDNMLSHFLDDLVRQLESLQVDKYKVIPSTFTRKNELDDKEKQDLKNRIVEGPFGMINQLQHLQFHVADQCNLKCRSCQHFSNLVHSGTEFPAFESVSKDFNRCRELFDNINVIMMLGGEPLLNPELDKYCYMLRALFPYSRLVITSNGLLVRKMSANLLEAIRENQVEINITYYPVLENMIDDITEFLIKNGILYHISHKVRFFSKKITLCPEKTGSRNFEECRDRCCYTLRDGKIYPCYLPATIHIFNKQYNTTVGCQGENGIDIYDEQSGLDIVKRLRQKFDICRYCSEDEICLWNTSVNGYEKEDWIVKEDNG